MKRQRNWLLSALAVAASGCGPAAADADPAPNEDIQGGASTQQVDVREESMPVVVARAEHGPVASWIVASGNLEAVELVEVLAKVPGQVETLAVEEGTRVNQGDVLVELDPNEYRIAAARAEAELNKKQADMTRFERMLSEGVLSQVDFDQAVYDVRQAELAHEQALIDLDEATVRAPITGVISVRNVHRGARVSSNEALFTIVNPDRLWVHVHVPEADLPGLAAGQVADVSSDVVVDGQFEAVVDRIAPVVDPQSGTAKVTVRIESGEALRPGMFVNVKITTARRDDALLIPKRAIVYAGDSTAVYRIDRDSAGETATQVPVRLGASDAEHVEVVDGLEPGDRVVVLGQDSLRTGMPVKVVTGESVGLAAGR
ncbi:MAG: efflux RND transporter periplasmic adaptor subunit [Acidobacteria bacterium]|nr:efflux RND transporter periplasmic adaptor subunit [Acidobacteriota bacterium]